jgi:hypothetical protein
MKLTEIFIDLDGVHADFELGIKKITGKLPHELPKRDMWKAVAKAKTFFEDLELMPDAKELFEYVSNIPNTHRRVLTGMPTVNDGAGQKRRWVAKHLCNKIEVIVLASKDKHLHSGEGKILIDDRQDMITAWQAAGGIGILHTSAKTTIIELKSLGF